ncbi:ATPase [Bryobacterales bacterium F-183]|nr:ATPase [Bryobacterales bacterium F-183]
MREEFPEARFVDLLDSSVYRDYSARPELLRERHESGRKLIVIDEIQRLPELLHEVHLMIQRDRELRFILTGSSARALRTGGVNLLGGRARVANLYPLTFAETGPEYFFRRLEVGSLPSILTSDSPWQDMNAYAGLYLQEEIRAEGAVRSIEAYSRFLDMAGASNGQLLNFTQIGSDAQVPSRTVREYYQLLEDTLLGFPLKPYGRTEKRKPVATAKFYMFDVGIANYLMKRRSILPGSKEFGDALEHQIVLECRAWLGYSKREDGPLTFWRTHSKHEVDLLLGDDVAIEVKGSEIVSDYKLDGMRALAEEIPLRRKIVVSMERVARRTADGIEIVPAVEFVEKLWNGEFDV